MKRFLLFLAFAAPVLAQNKTQPAKPTAPAKPAANPAAKPLVVAPNPAPKQIVVEAAKPTVNLPTPDALKMVPPLGHAKNVVDAVASPDGRWIASLSEDGMIRLWEAATGRTSRVMQHFEPLAAGEDELLRRATTLLFSRDGTRLFSGAANNILRVWNVASGQLLGTWDGPSQALALDKSGRRLLGGGKSFQIWDAQNGAVLKTFERTPNENGNIPATQLMQWADDERSFTSVTFMGNIERFDAENGAMLSHFHTHCDPHALSPDGKTILVRGDSWSVENGVGVKENQSALIDCATGAVIQIVVSPANDADTAWSGAFSPDGKWVILGLKSGGMLAHEIASKREIWPSSGVGRGIVVEEAQAAQPHPAHRDLVESLRFSPNGQFLISGSDDKTARLWSWPQWQEVATFRGYAIAPEYFLLSGDGTRLALATNASVYGGGSHLDCSLRVIDVASGRVLRSWNLARPITALAWDKANQHVWAASGTGILTADEQVWEINAYDAQSGERSAPLVGHTSPIDALALSADGKRLVGITSTTVHLWDGETRRELMKAETQTRNVGFAPNGDVLKLELNAETFNPQSGESAPQKQVETWDLPEPEDKTLRKVAFFMPRGEAQLVSEGRQYLHLAVGCDEVSQITTFMVLRDAQSGATVKGWPFPTVSDMSELFLTPDQKHALIFDPDTAILRTWDVAAGGIVGTQKLPEGTLHAALSNDQKLIFTLGADNVTRFVQAQTGKPLLSYLVMDNGDWLAYTADGRFDGTPGGLEKVYFQQGNQTFSLDQFAERFYQPGLVDLVLRGTGLLPAPSPGALLAQGAPPVVKITSPQAGAAAGGEIEVSVEARAQNNGGVKAIRLYHNGRLVGGPANLRSIVVEAALPAAQSNLVQKFSVTLTPGDNFLRAVAYSQTDLESRPDEIALNWNAPPGPKPRLYILAIGVNAYRDATMNLTYARPDAEAMSEFFEANKSSFSDVRVTRLMDAAASRQAIQNALMQMAKDATPDDVAVIYLAGHGETAAQSLALDKDENAPQTFYFLPADAEGMILKEQVRRAGLSGPAIDELVSKIPARKVLMIYDACKSGAAVDDLTRAGAQEQQALGLLARAQGIYVLTASNSQQYAGEVRALGHGILTYALLEGLGGKAADVAKTVRVKNLLDYSKERVPSLAKEYRGREQWPISFGRGQNFPLNVRN